MKDRPLKILMAHKLYHPFGGPESYMFAWKKLFESKGHKVIIFSMQHPDNLPSPQSKYFPECLDLSSDKKYGPLTKMRIAAKLVYNFEARRKMARLIRDEKPDIAHFQNIYHQISPSIITPLYRNRIPIVMKLADYKLICLSYRLLRNGRICERCISQQFWRALPVHCVKNSSAKTTLNYAEHLVHRTLRLYEKIDLLIPPSNFSRLEHIKMGMPAERFVTIENFADLEEREPNYEHKGYIVYFGRLSEEKGILTLIKAMKEYPQVLLKIAGSGPEEDMLRSAAIELGAKNVEFIGFKTGNELVQLIRNCAFTVIPSEWYENCSNTVIESFAYGKPVIGAEIGGIPEQVIHGKNGYLHPPGDEQKLGELINSLYCNEELIRKMGMEARRTVETKYSGERHYRRLMEVYRRLIAEKTGATAGN